MAKVSRRTNLASSPELQLLVRLASVIGPDMILAAEVLVRTNYSFESAARLLMTWNCPACPWTAPMGRAHGIDPKNPRCPRCWQELKEDHVEPASLRQRVHRLQVKWRDLLGGGYTIDQRRRAAVRFGADDNGVYRTAAGRSDSMDPAEAAEIAEESMSEEDVTV